MKARNSLQTQGTHSKNKQGHNAPGYLPPNFTQKENLALERNYRAAKWVSHVPGSVPNTLQMVNHLILLSILQDLAPFLQTRKLKPGENR